MPGPDKPHHDAVIKRLLVSRDPGDHRLGLEMLDQKYRRQIPAYIRHWSDALRYGLNAADLSDIWQETLMSVWRQVGRGNFKENGRLDALLRTIARRRAIDLLRRRPPHEWILGELEFEWVEWLDRNEELVVALEDCATRLTERLRVVLLVDVDLFHAHGQEWVPLVELVIEINRRLNLSMSKKAVSNCRCRARQAMRDCLNEKGYDVP